MSVVSEDFMPEAKKLVELSALPSFTVCEIPHPLASVPKDKLGYHAEAAMRELERILLPAAVAPQQKPAE